MTRISFVLCAAVGFAVFEMGCDKSSEYKPVAEIKKGAPKDGHEHGAKGPHGGGIVELGEDEYHAELVVDHDSHAIIVYVLGKDAKTAEAIPAADLTVTPEGKDAVTLKATPQPGDAEGKASKFSVENDELVHAWMDAGFVHGKLRVTIAEKPYVGDIDYHIDGDHDHEHAKEEKK